LIQFKVRFGFFKEICHEWLNPVYRMYVQTLTVLNLQEQQQDKQQATSTMVAVPPWLMARRPTKTTEHRYYNILGQAPTM
jgi:hypothetical protein